MNNREKILREERTGTCKEKTMEKRVIDTSWLRGENNEWNQE